MEEATVSIQEKLNKISPITFREKHGDSVSKEITIGLDFGTSTTKSIINIEGEGKEDEYFAIQFPTKPDPTFFYPTAISYKDGELYFGDLAAQFPENKTIYSCKMAIPCQKTWNDFNAPPEFMWNEYPGTFLFRQEKISFSSAELAILYLSNVIRMIGELVKNVFPYYNPTYSLNMACPLDQLEKDYFESFKQTDKQAADKENRKRDKYIEEAYNAISQYSLLLSSEAKNPWKIEDACRCVKEVQKEPLKGVEESRVLVIPETLAAISSYIKRSTTEQGRYMTIDVGAGTTDISVFWLQKDQWKSMPHYYSSGSLHIGVDQFDAVLSLRNVLDSYLGTTIRDRREKLIQKTGGLSIYKDIVIPYLMEMLKHREKYFALARDKEKKIILGKDIWGDREETDLTMVFYGGGSKLNVIKHEFTNSDIWKNTFGAVHDVKLPNLEICKKALAPNGIANIIEDEEVESNLNLLLIAEGLASKSIDIPEYGVQAAPIHEHKRVEPEEFDYKS